MKKLQTVLMGTLAAVVAASSTGCYVSGYGRSAYSAQYVGSGAYVQGGGGYVVTQPSAVVVTQAPPQAVVQTTGPVGMGGQGQVWVDGHYEWQGSNYVWIDGSWSMPPQAGYTWQQPAYYNNQWYGGYWRAQNQQVPTYYNQGNGYWNAGYSGGGYVQGGGGYATGARPVTNTGYATGGVSVSGNVGGTVVYGTGASGGVSNSSGGGYVRPNTGPGVAPAVLPRKPSAKK